MTVGPLARIALAFLVICTARFATAAEPAAHRPQVLLIGDSISIGYTPFVTRLLETEATVTRHKGNGQHTGTGLRLLDEWIGTTRWDVIHFNWGLWDLCYRHPEARTQGNRDKVNGTLTTPLAQYEHNLEQLVRRLKQTGATLIWAHTTVVPEAEAGRIVGDDRKYNEVAARVMKRHGIAINDLHALSVALPPAFFVGPGDVHLKPEGYQKLADQVAESIRSALRDRTSLAAKKK